MTSLQPARRRPRLRTRRRRPPQPTQNRARGYRLSDIHWGWYATLAVAVIAAAQTWPLHTAAGVFVAAFTLIAIARPTRPTAPGPSTAEGFYRLDPTQFEHAIARLARSDPRVRAAAPVGGSGDDGIDVLVELRNGERWFIQCKRHQYGNNVGSGVLRDANGSYRELHGCHHAAVVTTAGFTRQAKETNDRFRHPLALFTGQDTEEWANGGPAPWDRPRRRRG